MRMPEVKLGVALLFVVFGWSSWIDVNGVWVELPLMVHRLPENWNLPSYLVLIIQAALIGPLVYAGVCHLIKKYNAESKTTIQNLQTGVIFCIVSVGALAVLFISFFWDVTSVIGGEERSTVLLTLSFALAMVDTLSSVTFLPFLAHFKPVYMAAFCMGEGMSGLLPTIIAFIQGSGEYTCVQVNATGNGTENADLQPLYADLLFTVRDFFLMLFVMLIMSLLAFALLQYSRFAKSERVKSESDTEPSILYTKPKTLDESSNSDLDLDSKAEIVKEVDDTVKESLSTAKYRLILTLMTLISGVAYGALPSIQIYSLLPYGQLYYSWGMKLATLCNPLACALGFFIMSESFLTLGVLTSMAGASALYILVIACFSPEPPIEGDAAAVAMVIVWIFFSGTVAYLRMLLSKIGMRRGHSGLFWLGMCTQIGSFIGALSAFLCTSVFQLLGSASPC